MRVVILLVLTTFGFYPTFAQSWNEKIKMVAPDQEVSDRFGQAVSIDGDVALVGAFLKAGKSQAGDNISKAGAAYFYEKEGDNNWRVSQKISASDLQASDLFGAAVSVHGNYAIVGAWKEDANEIHDAGSAYIFEKDISGQWQEVQKISASDGDTKERFGYAVSIHGNIAVVGAYWGDNDLTGSNPIENAGAAYLYERDATGHWNEVQKLVATDRGVDAFFGKSVSIYGQDVLVGAYAADLDDGAGDSLQDAGSAYLFERTTNGNWVQKQILLSSDIAEGDQFGYTVQLHGDYAVVCAQYEDEDVSNQNPILNSGSVYLYQKDQNGNWNEQQKIVPSDRQIYSEFGSTLCMSGNYLLVGAYGTDYTPPGGNIMVDAGAAYLFEKKTSGKWKQTQRIWASNRSQLDVFGLSVGMSGSTVIAAALGTNGTTVAEAGVVYAFEASTPLGINKDFQAIHFQAYPNPTKGNFVIDLGESYSDITVTVRNIMGQLISTQKVKNATQVNLKIEGPAGFYMVTVQTGNEKIAKMTIAKE